MNDIIPLYFYSFVIITVYIVCTLVNLWCLFVMCWLIFDVYCLEFMLAIYNKYKARRRRKKFKLIKGKK